MKTVGRPEQQREATYAEIRAREFQAREREAKIWVITRGLGFVAFLVALFFAIGWYASWRSERHVRECRPKCVLFHAVALDHFNDEVGRCVCSQGQSTTIVIQDGDLSVTSVTASPGERR